MEDAQGYQRCVSPSSAYGLLNAYYVSGTALRPLYAFITNPQNHQAKYPGNKESETLYNLPKNTQLSSVLAMISQQKIFYYSFWQNGDLNLHQYTI